MSYISGGGYRADPKFGNSYTIPAFDAAQVKKAEAAYDVGAYPTDVSYHPVLDLVAGTNGQGVSLFDRKTGKPDPNHAPSGAARFQGVGRVLATCTGLLKLEAANALPA